MSAPTGPSEPTDPIGPTAPAGPSLAEEVSTTLSKDERREKRWAETKMDLKWATALLIVLILAVAGSQWGTWQARGEGTEDMGELAQLIFAEDGLVAPFEILAVLLLAALVGGLIIALRDPPLRAGDGPHAPAKEKPVPSAPAPARLTESGTAPGAPEEADN